MSREKDYKNESKAYFIFVFSITNYCNGDENLNIRRKSYIFVRKELEELEKIAFNDGILIANDEKVHMLIENFEIIEVEFKTIRNW